MKRTFFSVALMLLSIFATQLNAQVNRGFAFQGYARNADGSAVSDQTIQVKFSIFPNGSAVQFEETQSVQTDAFGIFVADIGTENDTDFNALQFENFDYFLKVEVALPGSSFVEISNKQLKSVPYAQSANTAVSASTALFASNGVPSGTILPFAGSATNVPDGYVICDGTGYDGNSQEYAALFGAIGNNWGEDGTKFRVPDLRGYFLRGVDGGAGNDPDAAGRFAINGSNNGDRVGSYQNDALKIHNHDITDPGHKHTFDTHSEGGDGSLIEDSQSDRISSGSVDSATTGITINNKGDATESRPKNAYVLYIIKL